jgi:hypothetical protein
LKTSLNLFFSDILSFRNIAPASTTYFTEIDKQYALSIRAAAKCLFKDTTIGNDDSNDSDENTISTTLTLLPNQLFILPLKLFEKLNRNFLTDYLKIYSHREIQ